MSCLVSNDVAVQFIGNGTVIGNGSEKGTEGELGSDHYTRPTRGLGPVSLNPIRVWATREPASAKNISAIEWGLLCNYRVFM